MPIITVKQTFKIAIENGNKVVEIEKGDQDVSDRIAEVAVNQLKVATITQWCSNIILANYC